jgi:hypothetical protein
MEMSRWYAMIAAITEMKSQIPATKKMGSMEPSSYALAIACQPGVISPEGRFYGELHRLQDVRRN